MYMQNVRGKIWRTNWMTNVNLEEIIFNFRKYFFEVTFGMAQYKDTRNAREMSLDTRRIVSNMKNLSKMC